MWGRRAANVGLVLGAAAALAAVPARGEEMARAPEAPARTTIGEPIAPGAGAPYLFLHDDNFVALQADNGWPALLKFQVSVRFELVTLGEVNNFTLNLAYTQKSFWNVFDFQNSSPFVENDYKPELFVSYRPHRFERWRELQIGIQHESDGLGAVGGVDQTADSRGWSAAFFEGRWGISRSKPSGEAWFFLTPGVRAWLPFAVHPTELVDAIGYFYAFLDIDLRIPSHPWVTRVSTRIKVYEHAFQGTFYYPLLALMSGGRVRPWLFLQVFHGQAERLITYNEVVNHFYVGFGFQ
jgi:phospholipase A1